MAIRAVAHPLAQASIRAVGVPRLVLAFTLVAPALALFVRVQPTPALGVVGDPLNQVLCLRLRHLASDWKGHAVLVGDLNPIAAVVVWQNGVRPGHAV